MATKREVMLSGVPAKLAHMLASDPPASLTPTGTDINSALLLESNWVIVFPSPGIDYTGFRLPPATGQFLYCIRNSSSNYINVYPDFTEQMNSRAVAQPWVMGPQQTGFFLPSRRQWLCGTMSNDNFTTLQGPVSIGMAAPTDATQGDLFVGSVLAVALSARPGQPVPTEGRMSFNAYWDAAGSWRYLANGSACLFRYDNVNQLLQIYTAVAGLADQVIPGWQPFSTPVAQFGTSAGPNGTFLSGAVGMGRVTPTDSINGQLFASQLLCGSLSARPGIGTLAGRFTFNAYFDAAGNWRYLDNGPAMVLRFDAISLFYELTIGPSGTAGAVIPFPSNPTVRFMAPANLASGQTSLMLTTNEAGTLALQQVLVGAPLAAAAAGMPVGARALYVAT
jgi:hypothetical protein